MAADGFNNKERVLGRPELCKQELELCKEQQAGKREPEEQRRQVELCKEREEPEEQRSTVRWQQRGTGRRRRRRR